MDNEHVKQEEKNLVIVGPKEYVKPEPDGGYTLEVPGYRSSRGSSSIYINPEHVDKITVLVQPFNAYSPAKVEGPAVLWSYADGHGKVLGAILIRNREFTMWVPGTHDHGPGEKYRGFVGSDGSISWSELPVGKTLEMPGQEQERQQRDTDKPGELVVKGDRQYVRRVEGGYMIQMPSAARNAGDARIFIPDNYVDRVVFLTKHYNARSSAKISGPAVLWSYADGHGMELGAVLERGKEFTLWVPDHHDHGPGEKYKGFVGTDGEISCKKLPTAPFLKLPEEEEKEEKQENKGQETDERKDIPVYTDGYKSSLWVEGDGYTLEVPSMASMRRRAMVHIPASAVDKVAILMIGGDVTVEGPAVLWQYGDHHGRRTAAVLLRGKGFRAGSRRGFVNEDGTIEWLDKEKY